MFGGGTYDVSHGVRFSTPGGKVMYIAPAARLRLTHEHRAPLRPCGRQGFADRFGPTTDHPEPVQQESG